MTGQVTERNRSPHNLSVKTTLEEEIERTDSILSRWRQLLGCVLLLFERSKAYMCVHGVLLILFFLIPQGALCLWRHIFRATKSRCSWPSRGQLQELFSKERSYIKVQLWQTNSTASESAHDCFCKDRWHDQKVFLSDVPDLMTLNIKSYKDLDEGVGLNKRDRFSLLLGWRDSEIWNDL